MSRNVSKGTEVTMDKTEKEIIFDKCYDYINAIIALAERNGFSTESEHAIKTLAIDCSNALTRLEEEECRRNS